METNGSFLGGADTEVFANTKPGQEPSAFHAQDLFERNKESVVNIALRMSVAGQVLDQTLGSGFFIDNSQNTCRVATDLHVVDKATSLSVRLSDSKSYKAKIELEDPANDLAILKLENMADAKDICKPLELAEETEPVQAGQELLKLSARMNAPEYGKAKVEEYFLRKQAGALPLLSGENPERKMIYLAGPSQNGDSGGPIIDADGRVIGIDSAVGDGGFAVTPSFYLKKNLDVLKNTKS